MKKAIENTTVNDKRLPFMRRMLTSIESLKGLHCFLDEKYGIEYILTHRLNQDVLENFFSYIRAMGTVYDHPNPASFKHRLRWYILGKHSHAIFVNKKNTIEAEKSQTLVCPLNSPNVNDNETRCGVCGTSCGVSSGTNDASDDSFQVPDEELITNDALSNFFDEADFVDDLQTLNDEPPDLISPDVAPEVLHLEEASHIEEEDLELL